MSSDIPPNDGVPENGPVPSAGTPAPGAEPTEVVPAIQAIGPDPLASTDEQAAAALDGADEPPAKPGIARGWIIAAAVVLVAAVVGLVLWLLNNDDDTAAPTENIPDTLAADPDFSTLSQLLASSGLDEALAGPGPLTLFAPANDAFAAFDPTQLAEIQADPDTLAKVLTYHVVAEKVALTTSSLTAGPLTMLDGQTTLVSGTGSSLRINTAAIVTPDVEASNGIIQGIDALLVPPDLVLDQQPTQNLVELLAASPDYSTYTQLVAEAGLTSQLNQAGPFTLFAPDNAAFAAVDQAKLAKVREDPTQLRSLVQYTIAGGSFPTAQLEDGASIPTEQGGSVQISVDGSTYKVDDATIIDPDNLATNGVLHGLNQVIVPPGTEIDLTPAPTQNVVQIIGSQPAYSTLSSLLATAGLTDLLSQTGPYTVFGPNNDAFAALPADTLAYLQSNVPLLRQVLAYHVVLANLPTEDLQPGTLNSLEGSTLNITVEGTTYRVNGAIIVEPDLLATNGVVQGIDQVLVPPGVDINPPPPTTTTAPTTEAPTTAPPTTAAGSTDAPTTAPPPTDAPTTVPPTTAPPAGQDLYEVIASDPAYSLVLQLIDAAGLQQRLETGGPGTLFVPTNGAFGASQADGQAWVDQLIATLTADELAELLSYSAAQGLITTQDLQPGQTIATLLAGEVLTVVDGPGIPEILGSGNSSPAVIVKADTDATNGLVQGVNMFLVPSGITVPPPA
jgi:uncharacterized surface protein with fasciclin (FAS1) repeats